MSARDPERTSPYTDEQQAQREPGEAPRGDISELSRDQQLQFSQARRQERQQAQQVREQTAERVSQAEPVDIGPGDVDTRIEDGELRSELTTEARGELVRGRTAEQISETEGVDISPSEVETTFEAGEWDAELTTGARDRVTLQRAVNQIEDEYDVEAERSDFTLSDGEVDLTDELEGEIEQELEEEAIWEAKLEADQAFTEATGINVQPDDFRVVGDEIEPKADIQQQWYDKVEEQAQEQAAENLEEEYGADIDPEEFEYYQGAAHLDEDAMAELDTDVRAQIDAETLSTQREMDIDAEDISYNPEGEIQLDEDVQAEIDAERLSEEYQTDIGARDIDYQDDGVVIEDPVSLGIDPATGDRLSPAERVSRQTEELEVDSFDSGFGDYEPVGSLQESVETPTLAQEFIANQQGVEADDISVDDGSIVVDETRSASEIVGGAFETNVATPIGNVIDEPVGSAQAGLADIGEPVTSFAADPVESTYDAIDAGQQNAVEFGEGVADFGRDVGDTVGDVPGSGALVAAAPVAAAEPTPVGEATLAGGAAVVGTVAVGSVAADRADLNVGRQTREIEVPTGGTGMLEGEIETPMEPAEAVTSEIATPAAGGSAFGAEFDVPEMPSQSPAELETPSERAGTQGDLTIQTAGQFAQESLIDAGELEQEETERLFPAEEISGTDPEGSVDVEEQQFAQRQDELTMIQDELGGTAIEEGEVTGELIGGGTVGGELIESVGEGAVWEDTETLERVYEPTETGGAEDATEAAEDAAEDAEFPSTFEETQSLEVLEDEGGFEQVEEDTSFELVEESQQFELSEGEQPASVDAGAAGPALAPGGPLEDFEFDYGLDSPSDATGEMDREFDQQLDAIGDVDLETSQPAVDQATPEAAAPALEFPPLPEVATPAETGLDTAFETPVETPPGYEMANPTGTGEPGRPRRPPRLPDLDIDGDVDAPDIGGPGWGEARIERELPDPGIVEAEVDDMATGADLDPVEELGDLDAL